MIFIPCLFIEGEFLFFIHLLGKIMLEKSFGNHLKTKRLIIANTGPENYLTSIGKYD